MDKRKRTRALISNANNGGAKKMLVGENLLGKTFVDISGNVYGEVKIAEDGNGDFIVNENSYSVWCII